jgi:hypothetical protein
MSPQGTVPSAPGAATDKTIADAVPEGVAHSPPSRCAGWLPAGFGRGEQMRVPFTQGWWGELKALCRVTGQSPFGDRPHSDDERHCRGQSLRPG